MENISCDRVTPALRKQKKKKQVKDEHDRLKQAERKKRRLEKALATSAAIRSELEKKKQKKKEEQQRLDEEGAAIAEAVALHVLLGDDSDDPCHVVNKNRKFEDWNYSGGIGIFMDCESLDMNEGQNLFSSIYRGKYDDWGIEVPMTNGMHGISLQVPCLEVKSHTAELSAGLIAAQALLSLRIADDSQNGKFISEEGTATAVLNRMLEGGDFDNESNFCENLWAT